MEDEFHAFFQCSLHDDIKQLYLPPDLFNANSLLDLYNILGKGDCNVIRKNLKVYILYVEKKKQAHKMMESAKTVVLQWPGKATLPFWHIVKWKSGLNEGHYDSFISRMCFRCL